MTSTEQQDLPLVFTVEDRSALHALPTGTCYVDVEGDFITKHSDGQWYVAGSEWPWGVALLEEFLPGIVVNPEIL